MSEMRARFVVHLLDGELPDDLSDDMSGNNAPSSGGSTELF